MSLPLHDSAHSLPLRVSDFLINEAELLDNRELETWFGLFDQAAQYRVLPLQSHLVEQEPDRSLFIIADDYTRLRERVDSLLSGHTWMEKPLSRTRRQVSNVRIKTRDGEQLTIKSNFVVHQFRHQQSWNFIGEATHVLRDSPDGLRILRRDIRLDHETINDQRRISIIL